MITLNILNWSKKQGVNDSPINICGDDMTYEELKGHLNKVTLMHHHCIQGHVIVYLSHVPTSHMMFQWIVSSTMAHR
jgi:hypothetical protein